MELIKPRKTLAKEGMSPRLIPSVPVLAARPGVFDLGQLALRTRQ
jgi:hypothetical protein